jgi:uncharacterized protein YecE (DUF72 family)
MATAWVGVSGWRYRSWRGDFYPTGLAQRRELSYVAARTTSVEVNGSFYSLLRPTTYSAIHDQTPAAFRVAVKGGRYITHMRKLSGVEAPLANFFASGVLALRGKLGPVLWQLPPQLPYDEERLVRFLDLLPRTTRDAAALATRHDDRLADDRVLAATDLDRPIRHALEVRHPSYCTDHAVDLLRRHDIALVLADSPHRWPLLERDTSDFRYLRLHGHPELYASGYSDRTLDWFAARARRWLDAGQDVYVYFDNDSRGHAPYDAVRLLERLAAP